MTEDNITYDRAVEMAQQMPLDELCRMADGLRCRYTGRRADICSIMNARSGRCSEDCKWCSQSAFHKTDVEVYPLVGCEAAVREAAYNRGKGVHRFSLVTSGRTMSDADVDRVCGIYRHIAEITDIKLCASMGLLNGEQLRRLRESGVSRYHCNLETAPSYFGRLCTTHTPEEKIATLRAAKEAGLEICSGGIIGMGESMEHRIELAVTLRDLGVDSIPVNILNPIKGTALEGMAPLPDDEIVRTVAMFRILNPAVHIRLAGGRGLIGHLVPRLLRCGVSALITGDMLTTTGSAIDADKGLLAEAGFDIDY